MRAPSPSFLAPVRTFFFERLSLEKALGLWSILQGVTWISNGAFRRYPEIYRVLNSIGDAVPGDNGRNWGGLMVLVGLGQLLAVQRRGLRGRKASSLVLFVVLTGVASCLAAADWRANTVWTFAFFAHLTAGVFYQLGVGLRD